MAQQQWISAIDRYFNQTKIRYMGLGVMLAWVYCTWFSDGIFAPSEHEQAISTLMVSLSFSVIGLLILAFRPKKGHPLNQRSILVSAIVLSLATLSFLLLPYGMPMLVAAAFGGLFGGLMWVAWGELYCMIDPDVMESAIPASLVAFIVATSAVYLLPSPLSGVVASLYPFITGTMLLLCRTDEDPAFTFPERREPFARVLPSLTKLAFCSMVCSIATGYVVTSVDALTLLPAPSDFILVYVAGALVAMCLAVLAIARASHIDISFLYEWAIPFIVFSLSLRALDLPLGNDVAVLLACSAALYVEMLFYLIFSRISGYGFCLPSETFGIFRAVVQLGFLLGGMANTIEPLASIPRLEMCLLFICLCVVMLPLFLHLQNRFDVAAAAQEEALPEASAAQDPMPEAQDVVSRMASEYKLSPRESEVLSYLSKGRSVPYMREAMVISKNTIETHIKHIYAKCGVHSRQELLDLIERS